MKYSDSLSYCLRSLPFIYGVGEAYKKPLGAEFILNTCAIISVFLMIFFIMCVLFNALADLTYSNKYSANLFSLSL